MDSGLTNNICYGENLNMEFKLSFMIQARVRLNNVMWLICGCVSPDGLYRLTQILIIQFLRGPFANNDDRPRPKALA